MSVISGKKGTLLVGDAEVARLTRWTIEKISRNKAYTANDTGGAKKRVGGARDCAGRFQLKAAPTQKVPVEEGDAVTLRLHVDDSPDNYYEVPAVIDTIRTAVDVDKGNIIAYKIAFSGNGPIGAYGILEKASGSGS